MSTEGRINFLTRDPTISKNLETITETGNTRFPTDSDIIVEYCEQIDAYFPSPLLEPRCAY